MFPNCLRERKLRPYLNLRLRLWLLLRVLLWTSYTSREWWRGDQAVAVAANWNTAQQSWILQNNLFRKLSDFVVSGTAGQITIAYHWTKHAEYQLYSSLYNLVFCYHWVSEYWPQTIYHWQLSLAELNSTWLSVNWGHVRIGATAAAVAKGVGIGFQCFNACYHSDKVAATNLDVAF